MKLFATPLSSFSRKVRLLLDHYEVSYEFVDVGNVASSDIANFVDNPIMNVPVLQDGDIWMVESDHIAAYLTRKIAPEDIYNVLASDPPTLNARAILNGVMSNVVKLILAERTGLSTKPHRYFQKAETVVRGGLFWLDQRADIFSLKHPTYLDFHLVSAWDHMEYFAVTDLTYPSLEATVAGLNERTRISQSAPQNLKLKS